MYHIVHLDPLMLLEIMICYWQKRGMWLFIFSVLGHHSTSAGQDVSTFGSLYTTSGPNVTTYGRNLTSGTNVTTTGSNVTEFIPNVTTSWQNVTPTVPDITESVQRVMAFEQNATTHFPEEIISLPAR